MTFNFSQQYVWFFIWKALVCNLACNQAVCVTRFDQSGCGFCRVIVALGKSFFRGIYGEILALFQACVGNFDIIPPWKVVGTFYLDSSCITFKYFAFLSVSDKFELLGHVQVAMDDLRVIFAVLLGFIAGYSGYY